MNFEQIVELPDEQVQKVLKNLEMETLVLALKAASPMVKQKFESNMSERACKELNDTLATTGAVEMAKVAAAQEKLLSLLK